ncbi:MAG: LPS export ABC transporter periplasmic protein LptC [Hyphomicrobiaceae bacterium]
MTHENTSHRPSGRARVAASSATLNRGSLFRRAHLHSGLVRVLKFGLPIAAVLLLGSYALFMHRSIRLDGRSTLSLGNIKISTDNLTMENPRYEGFNKDGSKYVVTAKSAVTDIRQKDPVKLKGVDGRLSQQNGTVTDLKAVRGLFDTKSHVIELFEDIDIRSSTGMTAQLQQATVYSKESRIVSKEPVTVSLPMGQVRGNELLVLQKSREVRFGGGVAARLVPPARTGASPAPADRRQLAFSQAPVDITSATLDVDDGTKLAIFKSNVQAVQGDTTLTTDRLDIHYDSVAEEAGATAPKSVAAGAGKLKRMIAKADVVVTRPTDRIGADNAEFDAESETAVFTGNVTMTRGTDQRVTSERADVDTRANKVVLTGAIAMTQGADRRVTADRADIDTRTDQVVLTGTVAMTQGRNTLGGQHLFIDRKAGISRLASPAGESRAAGRIAARLYRSEAAAGKKLVRTAKPDTSGAEGWMVRPDATLPIDVEADTLDVEDTAKTAIFRGEVRIVQGGFTLQAAEVILTYTGRSGLAGQQAGQAQAQIERIKARKNTIVTSADGRSLKGDWAENDMKKNTIAVGADAGGNVLVHQGKTVLESPNVTIDLTTGITRLEGARPSASADAQQKGAAPPVPGAGTCGGRLCAVFHPKDMKSK